MASESSNAAPPSPRRPRSESISADIKAVVDMGVQSFAMGAASGSKGLPKEMQALYAYALGNYLTVAEVRSYARTNRMDEVQVAHCFMELVKAFPDDLGNKYLSETAKAAKKEIEEAERTSGECRTKSSAEAGTSSTDA